MGDWDLILEAIKQIQQTKYMPSFSTLWLHPMDFKKIKVNKISFKVLAKIKYNRRFIYGKKR